MGLISRILRDLNLFHSGLLLLLLNLTLAIFWLVVIHYMILDVDCAYAVVAGRTATEACRWFQFCQIAAIPIALLSCVTSLGWGIFQAITRQFQIKQGLSVLLVCLLNYFVIRIYWICILMLKGEKFLSALRQFFKN